MSLRKFLWGLSFSVFLAGLVYHYAGPLGLIEAGRDKNPASAGDIFSVSHRPNGRIISGIVGRSSTFWYLTEADRAVSHGDLEGAALVSWTDPVRQWGMFRDEGFPRTDGRPAGDDGVELDEPDPSPARGVRAGGKRPD